MGIGTPRSQKSTPLPIQQFGSTQLVPPIHREAYKSPTKLNWNPLSDSGNSTQERTPAEAGVKVPSRTLSLALVWLLVLTATAALLTALSRLLVLLAGILLAGILLVALAALLTALILSTHDLSSPWGAFPN
jgi:hypothetical protein